jgi:phage major head subunit gpT-like protein
MITPSNFSVFVTTVNTMIGHVYDTDMVDLVAPKISTELPCSSTQLVMGWTGLMPKMRAWFGARQPHEIAGQTYTVVPQPWENTYEIDRFALDDDQLGVYYRLLPDIARQARRHPDYQLRDLIENLGVQTGTRQLGLDGLTHWNSAHQVDLYNAGAGTYTNTTVGGQSVGGTTIGGALSPTSFTSVYEYMRTIKGEDGERLGIKGNMLMHPPTLKAEVELILKSTFFAPPSWGAYAPITGQTGTADNPLRRFGVEPLENEFLVSNTNWYLLDTTRAMKPFTWVVREPIHMAQRTNETDPVVFDTHKFLWGQWARNCPAWNLPFLSHRSGT